MAACSAGDQEEVAALLRQGADINHANIDGLTALHQVGKLTPNSKPFAKFALR